MKTRTQQIEELQKEWTQPRWEGIRRPYSAEEVVKLRGSVNPECTLAQNGAAKMWDLLHGGSKKGYINSLGALTRRMLTWPPACIRINLFIRRTRCRQW